ncbi:hypothetical protein [Salegentibacter maritimus]|uniref:hypothetical protein n=1 Tax=Salegentibacter maritimus TaxID=2794347 RepID=UPI0018E4C846|nr:hypothetical protein [Salegentibacter maritimus]MBI6117692.1 hypothetical protein [Salegentibacter maritimus]
MTSCINNSKKEEVACQNFYSDQRFDICLPTQNWKWEKIDSYIYFKNEEKDSSALNNSVISIMIDDYKSELSSKTLRDEHLKSMENSKSLEVSAISKGKQKINGETFYDFEINSKNGEIYSYFLFCNKGNLGYTITASVSEENRNDLTKEDYLKFFKSLEIK